MITSGIDCTSRQNLGRPKLPPGIRLSYASDKIDWGRRQAGRSPWRCGACPRPLGKVEKMRTSMARWLPVFPTNRTCTQGSVACAGICIGDGHRRNRGALTHKVAAARTSNSGKESLERPPAGSKSSTLSHLSFSVDGSTIWGRNSGEQWHTGAQNGLCKGR